MKYILVTDSDIEQFEKSVNDKIKQDYIPLGGISVATLNSAVPTKKIIYTQALTWESKQIAKK